MGLPGASRRPPGHMTNQSTKPRNLKASIEQWNMHGGMVHKGIFHAHQIVKQTAQTRRQISRGRWPCGRKPQGKRRTPFPGHIPSCVYVLLRAPTPAWLHFGMVQNSRIFEGLDIDHFWGLGGPGGPGNSSERWGAKPPHFSGGSRGLTGPPRPPKIPIAGPFKKFKFLAKVQPCQ